MMRSPALLTLMLLASCGEAGPRIVPAPLSPQEQACAAQVDDDPAVREARAIGAGQPDWAWQHGAEIEQMKRDAVTRCLKGRGLLSRGGVERAR